MPNNQLQEALPEFPLKARKYLNSFYMLRHVRLEDTSGKIDALRNGYDLEDTIVASDGGINGDVEELRLLEFYVLTRQGLLA